MDNKMRKIEQKIIDITNQQTGGNVNITDKLDNLPIDSIDIVELIMSVEEKFGVVITDDEFVQIESLKCISDCVNRKIH